MKVFHGSYMKIDEIDLSVGRDNLDFGKGFYVTKIRSQAEYWADRMGKAHKTKGVVSEFEFYERAFTDDMYKVLRFTGYNEEWLDFVVLNRDPVTRERRHDYDIVEGPVANDDVIDRLIAYLDGIISKPEFLKELTYHKPTHQICFCTAKSLQMIVPNHDSHYFGEKGIAKLIIAKLRTEKNIDKYDATDIFYNSSTFSKLSDRTTELYKQPWTDVYEMLKKELNL